MVWMHELHRKLISSLWFTALSQSGFFLFFWLIYFNWKFIVDDLGIKVNIDLELKNSFPKESSVFLLTWSRSPFCCYWMRQPDPPKMAFFLFRQSFYWRHYSPVISEDIVTIARLLMEAQSRRLHYAAAFAANGLLWTREMAFVTITKWGENGDNCNKISFWQFYG